MVGFAFSWPWIEMVCFFSIFSYSSSSLFSKALRDSSIENKILFHLAVKLNTANAFFLPHFV